MTPLAFLDIETTSLARPFSSTPGEVWEVGLIVRTYQENGAFTNHHHQWFLPVTLKHANPKSLEISRFHERHPAGDRYTGQPPGYVTSHALFARHFTDLVAGCHLVGNVVSFDEERLAALLLAEGVVQDGDEFPWHYHLIDVEALAAGALAGMETVVTEYGIPHDDDGMRLPGEALSYGESVMAAAQHARPRWDSEALSAALGVTPPGDDERHTALADARWAMALYDAVIGR